MSDHELTSQSIFNTIEERKDKPQIFAWSNDSVNFTYLDYEFIYENTLMTAKSKEEFETHGYSLVFKGLFKYEVILHSFIVI